ncbi:MAG: hypothetical protein KGN74_15385 [Gemmatimonadota bacterium]|nr:hypothetical protein [Gemmatimonadota bacterium]MDE3217044.1 hypothetical protein [Gemmatimonadota bacterium]
MARRTITGTTSWFATVAALLAFGAWPARAQNASPPPDSTAGAVHFRLVGVFDEETGEPIEGADVKDVISGLVTRTTPSGAAALFYTTSNHTLVTIRKIGYRPVVMGIGTGPADSTPVTVTLLHMGHVLPAVVVVGDRAVKLGKADTIPELLRNGFYLRRLQAAAPRSAFITGDKIQGVLLVSDARYFGRGICESNLYIDGMQVTMPPRTGKFLKEGIDAMLNPFDIAGIETYQFGEAPPVSTGTTTGEAQLNPQVNNMAVTGGNGSLNAAGTLAAGGCVSYVWLKH